MKTQTYVMFKKLALASLVAASMIGPVQAHSQDNWIGPLVAFAVIESIFDRGQYNHGHYNQYKKIKRRTYSHNQGHQSRRHNHSQGGYSISRNKHRIH
jgi:hypothetical protein